MNRQYGPPVVWPLQPPKKKSGITIKHVLLTLLLISFVVLAYHSANSITYYGLWQQEKTLNKELNQTLHLIQQDNKQLHEQVEDLEERLNKTEYKYDYILQENSRLGLKRLDKEELVTFLRADPTNEESFNETRFVCHNRAAILFMVAIHDNNINMSHITVNYRSPSGTFGHVTNGIFLENGTYLVIDALQDTLYDGSTVDWKETGIPVQDRVYPPLLESLGVATRYGWEEIEIRTMSEVWP
jgi:cell division protein FtsB